MSGKKGMWWGETQYDGQKAFGVIPPQTLQVWANSCDEPYWWKVEQRKRRNKEVKA